MSEQAAKNEQDKVKPAEVGQLAQRSIIERHQPLTAVQRADNEALSNFRLSTSVAGLCRELVMETAVNISGRKYVPAATMEAIAVAHGFVVSTRPVEWVPETEHTVGGFRCVAELKNIETGDVLSTSEGFVGTDEMVWFGGVKEKVWNKQTRKYEDKTYEKRPDFAIRAMCTTRACGRVCKLAFAHVLPLIDKKLETTPMEDVIDAEFVAEATATPSEYTGEPIYDWRNVHMDVPWSQKHGQNCKVEDTVYPHGRQLGELSSKALAYYQEKFVPDPKSPIEIRIRRALDISMGREQPDVKPANGDEAPA